MAWCPKCKEEYEDFVEMCAECKVPLVQSLEDINNDRMLIVVESEEEADKAIEFLKYSEINSGSMKKAENEYGEEIVVLYVLEEDWEKASKIMQGFQMVEKKDVDLDDYFFNEYETIDLENENKAGEYESSMYSLLFIGGIVAIVGLLQLFGIFDFLPGNLPYVFTILGIIMVIFGLMTKPRIEAKTKDYNAIVARLEELTQWYEANYPSVDFLKRHTINIEGLDEGAIYFAYMDAIVKECKTNTITEDELIINTVSDKVFHKILK